MLFINYFTFLFTCIYVFSAYESKSVKANRASVFNGLCKIERIATNWSIPHSAGLHLGMYLLGFVNIACEYMYLLGFVVYFLHTLGLSQLHGIKRNSMPKWRNAISKFFPILLSKKKSACKNFLRGLKFHMVCH